MKVKGIIQDKTIKLSEAVSAPYDTEVIVEIPHHLKMTEEHRKEKLKQFLCYKLQPDLVLLDLMMPGMDGIATTKAMRQQFPEVKILILTSFTTQDLVHQAIEAGANSYILKDASTEEIINAIRLTYHGLSIMSPDVTKILAVIPPSNTILTSRQLQVLKLIAKGLNNKQIGKTLNISTYTARFHVSEILSKLGVSNRTEAVSVALSRKLVQSQDL